MSIIVIDRRRNNITANNKNKGRINFKKIKYLTLDGNNFSLF